MPFDEFGETGEGTLEEYFTHKPMSEVAAESALPAGFMDEIDERDSAIDRLCLELFADRSGLARTEVMRIFWPETHGLVRKYSKGKGLVMIGWQPDDPIFALYKDGQPIAAFYASYRGVYQAGGYVASNKDHDEVHLSANNFVEGVEHDKWHEHESTCSDIAMDFLLGIKTNYL